MIEQLKNIFGQAPFYYMLEVPAGKSMTEVIDYVSGRARADINVSVLEAGSNTAYASSRVEEAIAPEIVRETYVNADYREEIMQENKGE